MEVIIWKLCTSKALGNRQRTVMLWQGRHRLASNVHFMPSFLQENPVLSVLSWQRYGSYHPRASLLLPGTPGSELGRWGCKGRGLGGEKRQTRRLPRAGRRQRVNTTKSPSLPRAVGSPAPCAVSTAVPELYATCCMGAGDDRCLGTSI